MGAIKETREGGKVLGISKRSFWGVEEFDTKTPRLGAAIEAALIDRGLMDPDAMPTEAFTFVRMWVHFEGIFGPLPTHKDDTTEFSVRACAIHPHFPKPAR
jgi:hypothetical protein